jgi:membrane peptidoglycan carboxypeptidase
MAKPKITNRKKNSKPRFYKRLAPWITLFLLILVGAVGSWLWLEAYTRDFRVRADTEYDLERINDLEVPSIILDRNGKEIGRIFVQNRSIIPISKVPETFVKVLKAGEDQRFDSHDGVDYVGVVRAAYLNWKAGETTQGASTITQQLARNAYDLEGERKKRGETGMQRKIVEMFLARRIEKKYQKPEILEFYLNRIYFGSGYYGIRSASLGYFGKEPMELNVLECAAIVGSIKNPTNLSPLNDADANRRSRNLVLARMVELGTLKKSEAQGLYNAPLPLNPKPLQRGTTHLYERVAEAVGREMGDDALASGGFTIHTTILKEAQDAAEKSLRDTLASAEAHPAYRGQKYGDYRKSGGQPPEYLQGAVWMVDHQNGEVLAHVGGRDYAQAPYDFIEMGKRPLGTAFFPFIYAAALDSGMTPANLVEDEAMDNRTVMVGGQEGILGEWGMEVPSPVYERKGVTLRKALEFSKIAATVRLSDQVGLKKVVDCASGFGFPIRNAELLPRIAVGFEEASLKQLVRGMSAFPLGGKIRQESHALVDHVQDAAGRVVFRRRQDVLARSYKVIDPATAWQVHSMMAGSLYRGSSKGCLEGLVDKPFTGAGKGGTTHDFADSWFCGYNPRITCGVWTGYLSGSGQPIYPGAFSRDLAMPVWQAAMNAAAPSFGGGSLAAPANVAEVQVCSVSGQRVTQYCHEYAQDSSSGVVKSVPTGVSEYFRRGTENLPFCSVHSGGTEAGVAGQGVGSLEMVASNAVPIRPKAPVLIGEDPYHTELPSFAASDEQPGLMRRSTNVLDSLDLGEIEERINLTRPKRLVIEDE